MFSFLLFSLDPTLTKNTWIRCCSENYLIAAMFKVLSKQIQGTLTMAFERHFRVKDFTEVYQHAYKSIMDQHMCKTYVQPNSFLVKHLNIMKQKLNNKIMS